MKINRIKLAKMLLKFGEVVEVGGRTLLYEGDFLEGLEIFVEDENGELIAIEDGEHELEDGRVIATEGGKITEIREKIEQEETIEDVVEDVADDAIDKDAEIERLKEAIEKKDEELRAKDEELKSLKKELEALKQKVEMSVQTPSHKVVKNTENKFKNYFN